jgi:hypothetical protein
MIRFSCIESLHTVNLNDFTVYSKSDGKIFEDIKNINIFVSLTNNKNNEYRDYFTTI